MPHKELERLNLVIASHIFATGPALELEEYLKNKVATLTFIGHPFSFAKERKSFYRSYTNKRLLITHTFPLYMPTFLFYFRDAFFTFWWTFKQGNIDLFIGSDNFLSFIGILLKKFGRVDKVILYTIDYQPRRFKNSILNYLYHYFDKMCLENCTAVWNVSDAITDAREKYGKLNRHKNALQITVPLGIWYQRIPKLPLSKRERYRIVFMGHLLEKQGLQMVIEALPRVLESLPKAQLVVIGTGEYEKNLKALVAEKKLDGNVKFLGYIESHKKVENELAKSVIAVATYKPDPESFTYYADPGKIKNYLAASLPVMLTMVPPIAKEIAQKKAAIICNYDSTDIANKIISLLSNESKLQEYSKNASKFAKKFDWNIVFENAISQSFL